MSSHDFDEAWSWLDRWDRVSLRCMRVVWYLLILYTAFQLGRWYAS